ncbi:hypothetical protein [Streptomyces sp. TP-A0874]|uniref:hypothetical protein n=1 Tax=Streptomyces sp. TP-A0874 TaxID=549819 RepID=UPI00147EDCA3|nr:hypothetical protein [Streptomyces sp. TP-A0874]
MRTTIRDNPEPSRHEIPDLLRGETPVGLPGCGIPGPKTASTPAQVPAVAQGSW